MKRNNNKKLVIFDMDGTLINSSITIANSINYVRSRLMLDPMDTTLILEKVNDHTINPAKFFYATENFGRDHEKWFAEYYTNNHEQELVLYDGIEEMLIALKERGSKLAVATNAYRRSTIESLTHLGVYDLFDTIACHDDVAQSKPHPDMLHKILTELDTRSHESLFVGDGSRDQIASQRAEIDYIMVNWGFSEYTEAISDTEELHKTLHGYLG